MIKKILNIMAILLVLLLIPINLFSFDENFYQSEFSKYGVYNKFDGDINLEFKGVLNFIENGDEIKGDFLNNKEREHLRDVRRLFIIKDVSIIICLVFLFTNNLNKKEFLSGLRIGGLTTIIFVIIMGLFSLFDFNSLFIRFHEVFFTNNLWVLNPETDNLIKLLPQEIFLDIFKRSLLLSFICSLLLLLIGFSQNSLSLTSRD